MHADLLKTELADFNARQQADFTHTEISTLLTQRSDFYDALLAQLWQHFQLHERNDLCLVAVGGYGRKEMFPLSDLDILVLSEQPLDKPTQNAVNSLFNLLWDSKFQLGSAVRTVDECVEIGRNELSVASNMFESRFLLGNKTLWQALMSHIFHADFWPIAPFFHAKMAEKAERYARYHNTSYNLEPDLKHSPGGLRDLHLVSWIMLRQYGTNSFEKLTEKGIFYPEEYAELIAAQNILFRMRFGLHLQLKRYDNRLRFDRQLQLSEQLGYQGEGNAAVEQMMKQFFQATQSISQLSELVLNHFEQTKLQPLQKKGEKQPLDTCFYRRDNQIYCQNPRLFTQQPHTILDLFWHLTEQPDTQVETKTVRQLRLALRQLKQPLSREPLARERFVALFSQANVVQRAILPMHRLGVLTAYLPQWHGIEGLMQFDLFHIYTVDEHTLRVMQNLEAFLNQESQARFPLCSRLFPALPQRHLLYLAALFHDIAKGREGDHAKVGAQDMLEFAALHNFNERDSNYMAWLVREHLTMSITAQRRDIHDPAVIQEFAKIVGNPTALSALTCLTVADIHATNETLWNDWKGSLFRKLHELTLNQLALGDEKALDQQKTANEQKQAALDQVKFVLSGVEHQKLDAFWQQCPTNYFLRNSPTQLVWHALQIIRATSLPVVLISNQYARGATEIFIHCDDQPQLFARIAQTLSQKKLSIHDAQIITGKQGAVLDSFIVTEQNGKALNELRRQQVQSALLHTLRSEKAQQFKPLKNPIKHQSFRHKTRVRFLPNTKPHQTAFELFTLDREGLLAQIGHIFNQLSLKLNSAKISTIGEKVEDFFVVSTKDNQALSDELQAALKTHIQQELDG